MNAGVGEVEWVVQKERYKYDEMFDKLGPIDGKISGAAAKQECRTSELLKSLDEFPFLLKLFRKGADFF